MMMPAAQSDGQSDGQGVRGYCSMMPAVQSDGQSDGQGGMGTAAWISRQWGGTFSGHVHFRGG